MRHALAGLLLVSGLLPASAQDAAPLAGSVVVRKIFSGRQSAAGQPIVLPAGEVEVAVSIYDIPAGARLPVHRHPFPRYGYVMAGTLDVTDVEAGKTQTYGPGSVIVEVVDRWHFGENKGIDPVRLLIVDQTPPGASATELRPQ